MVAIRVRIVRAEPQAVGEISAHNASIEGEVAVVGSGGDPQQRTTSAEHCCLRLSVLIEIIHTVAKPEREMGPAEERVMMRDRGRISNVVIPPKAGDPDLPPVADVGDMGSAIRNWIWATSNAIASGGHRSRLCKECGMTTRCLCWVGCADLGKWRHGRLPSRRYPMESERLIYNPSW